MIFLNVDFSKKVTDLFKEAFKFKKYKAMPIFFAIVVGICQLGFAASSFLIAGAIYVFNFVLKLSAIPIEFLHAIVRNEKDEVKAGAQTVIYLISWPIIFLTYALLVTLVLILDILYVLFALATFIWTLGGFKFHLLPSDATNIEKNVEGKYNKSLLIAFIVILLAILIILPLALVVLHYISLPELDQIYLFENAETEILIENIIFTTKAKSTIASNIADFFIFLYTLIVFIPLPKAKKAAPAITEAVAESAEAIEEAPVEENAIADEAPIEDAPVEDAPVEEEAPADAE